MAALTISPTDLSTGTLSPVNADSSNALFPSTIMPSTGILSPGLTTKISPFFTSSTEILTSAPSRITVVVLGARFIKLFSAFVVFPLERASSIFPSVIKARIIAADSKYKS